MTKGVTRPARCLLVIVGALAPLSFAWAQTAPPATAVPAYVDRVIENLPPEATTDDTGYEYNREGWPRFLRLETRLGTQPFDQTQSTRIGYGIYGLLETPNHGAL